MHKSPDTQGIDAPEWLKIIHEVNEARPGTFLEPDSVGPDALGNYVEEYPEARVIFPPENMRFTPGAFVLIEAKSVPVQFAIRDAARRLGFTSL